MPTRKRPAVIKAAEIMEPAAPSDTANVVTLLASAIDKGQDPTQLVELYERVLRFEAERAYAQAFSAMQSELEPVSRTSVGNRGRFAALDEIERAVKPVLSRWGFSYTWDQVEAPQGKICVAFILRHAAGHQERSTWTGDIDESLRANATQKSGSANSYARRYSMLNGLGLSTGERDDDAGGLDAEDAPLITPEQVAQLKDALSEYFGEQSEEIEKGWLTWLGYEAIEAIQASRFEKGRRGLEAKRRQQEAGQ